MELVVIVDPAYAGIVGRFIQIDCKNEYWKIKFNFSLE